MTIDNYGHNVGNALNAVGQLHNDVSKLLIAFDKKMAGWHPVFGSFCTKDLTYNFNGPRWMADGVYRYFSSRTERTLVEGIGICFFDPKLTEPLCAFAQIRYRDEAAKGVCQEWDIWHLALDHNANLVLDEVLSFHEIEGGRIASAKVIVVPIYSTKSMAQVDRLMDQVRSAGELVSNGTRAL